MIQLWEAVAQEVERAVNLPESPWFNPWLIQFECWSVLEEDIEYRSICVCQWVNATYIIRI